MTQQKLQIETQQKKIEEQDQLIKTQQTELEALKSFVCSQNPTAQFCRKEK